ncbi:MAG: NUDIX hydrolase [Candidatus Kariarchaeum pelagius]|jgi:8-oxo-dGTP pyrophosphatase MutT (NUDIX family)
MSKLDKHFTATTYIVHANQPITLLHYHRKLRTWLPPGGHLEKNETPFEAAIREIHEETGIQYHELEFFLNGEKPRKLDDKASILEMPHLLLSELIEENHYHLDWIFYAKYISNKNIGEENFENDFRWFNLRELENENDIIPNVKELAIKGIKEFY